MVSLLAIFPCFQKITDNFFFDLKNYFMFFIELKDWLIFIYLLLTKTIYKLNISIYIK